MAGLQVSGLRAHPYLCEYCSHRYIQADVGRGARAIMKAIHWRPQLSVGQPSIDQDHKHLIEYLNDLHAVIVAPAFSPVRAAKVLMKLLEYTHDHFAREENIMRKARYPRIEDHMRQHVEAVKAISDMSKAFTGEPTKANALRIYKFTGDWLVHHIIMEDTQLTPFVRGIWM
jgi:hemerythrin